MPPILQLITKQKTFMQDTHTLETVAIVTYPSQSDHQPPFKSHRLLPSNIDSNTQKKIKNQQEKELVNDRDMQAVERTDSESQNVQQPNYDTIFPQQEIKHPITIQVPTPISNPSKLISFQSTTLDKCDSDSPQESKIQDSDQQQKGIILFEKETETEPKQPAKWFYIGDEEEDDQISDEEEEEEEDIVDSSSSSSDDQGGEQQQVEDEQEDQDLDIQQDFEESDSDEEEPSDDQFPEDYDDEQEFRFQNMLRQQQPKRQENHMNKMLSIMQYKVKRQTLEQEQQKIKNFQLVNSLVPLPVELQLQKSMISQCILNLINRHYLLHLELEGGKRNQQNGRNSECDQIDSERETEQKEKVSDEKQKKEKSVRKVMFKESIQMKSFKDGDEVVMMNNKQEKVEGLNMQEKKPITKKVIALPKQFTLPFLPNSSDLIQKISKSLALQKQKKLQEEQRRKKQAEQRQRQRQRQQQLAKQAAIRKNQAQRSSQSLQNSDEVDPIVQFQTNEPERKYSIYDEPESNHTINQMNDQFLKKFEFYNQELKKQQIQKSEQIKIYKTDIDQVMKTREVMMKGDIQEFIDMNQIFSSYQEQEEMIFFDKSQQNLENEQLIEYSKEKQILQNQNYLKRKIQLSKTHEDRQLKQLEQMLTMIKGVEQITSDMNDVSQQIVNSQN